MSVKIGRHVTTMTVSCAGNQLNLGRYRALREGQPLARQLINIQSMRLFSGELTSVPS